MPDSRPPTFRKWSAPQIVAPSFTKRFKASTTINGQTEILTLNNAEYSALESVNKANLMPLFKYKNIGLKTLESLIAKGLIAKKSAEAV